MPDKVFDPFLYQPNVGGNDTEGHERMGTGVSIKLWMCKALREFAASNLEAGGGMGFSVTLETRDTGEGRGRLANVSFDR